MTSKTTQIIGAIVLIVIAFIGYKFFFVNEESSNSALVAENIRTQNFVEGQAILALLNRLNEVELDTSLFSSSVFTSLTSFAQPIPDQVIGRNNPFAPIGVDGSGTIIPAATSSRSE